MIEKFDIFLFNMIMESKANGEMRLLFSNRLKSLLKTINDSISKKLLEAERDIDVETKRMFIDFDENDPKRLSFIMINKLKDIFHESDYQYVIDKYPNFYDSIHFNPSIKTVHFL